VREREMPPHITHKTQYGVTAHRRHAGRKTEVMSRERRREGDGRE